MRVRRNLVLAFIIGLGLLGLVRLTSIWGVPFRYSSIAPSCPYVAPSVYCYNYNPLIVGLDYLFWTGVAFLLVSAADRVSARWGSEYREVKYDERARLKFFAALFSFGLAILSLMLGITNQATGLPGWYISALIATVIGAIFLKLPALNRGQDTG